MPPHGPFRAAIGEAARIAAHGPERGYVDDRAAARIAHQLCGCLHPEKNAQLIDSVVQLPQLVARVQKADRLEDTGIVDEDIESVKTVERSGDDLAPTRLVAYVMAHEHRVCADGCADLFARLVNVGQDNLRTCPGE
jgi:hypothetical protein